MKFYLQDCQTLKFMRCDSIWTVDINEAMDFFSARRATFFGMRELTDLFQILQIEQNGLSSVTSPQLSMASAPPVRPTRPTRAAHCRKHPADEKVATIGLGFSDDTKWQGRSFFASPAPVKKNILPP